MTSFNDGHPPDHQNPVAAEENASGGAVVLPFSREAAARRQSPTHWLTDAERAEFREMLAWYRDVRPKIDHLMTACPTARRELSALLRGD